MKSEVQPPVFHCELPLDKATRRKLRKTPTETNPAKSKFFPVKPVLYSRWITQVAKRQMMPTGTLMVKIRCQSKLSARKPPSIGPIDTLAAAAMDQNPMATPRFSGGNSRMMIAMPMGCIRPPPIPWPTRMTMSDVSFQEMPHKNENSENTTSPTA